MSNICTIILHMCLVGAVEVGPDLYYLDFIDNTGTVVRYRAEPVKDAWKFY